MARFRGKGDVERLACDFTNVTATGAVVAAPCFVYSISVTLTSSITSGQISLADTTAAADVGLESNRIDLKVGSDASAYGSCWVQPRMYQVPIAVQNQLFAALSTGIASVSVSYLAAS